MIGNSVPQSLESESCDSFNVIIQRCQSGDEQAISELANLAQGELYQMASQLCAGKPFAQSMHATSLVNEAFLRLLKSGVMNTPQSRPYFYSAAHQAMRNAIVDYLRRTHSGHRVPSTLKVDLVDVVDPQSISETDSFIESLNESLERLEAIAPRLAEVVRLRFFLRMTAHETASSLAVSVSTVEKDWRKARVWLFQDMNRS